MKETETVLEESNGQSSSTTLIKEESARMSRDVAMKAIEEERRERTTACGEDINKVLQKYHCSLVPHVEIVGQQVRSTVVIAAND
jgi:hypothetical protein